MIEGVYHFVGESLIETRSKKGDGPHMEDRPPCLLLCLSTSRFLGRCRLTPSHSASPVCLTLCRQACSPRNSIQTGNQAPPRRDPERSLSVSSLMVCSCFIAPFSPDLRRGLSFNAGLLSPRLSRLVLIGKLDRNDGLPLVAGAADGFKQNGRRRSLPVVVPHMNPEEEPIRRERRGSLGAPAEEP